MVKLFQWLVSFFTKPKPSFRGDGKRAMFVGRWQPPHRGHEWLIRQKLDQGVPVLILVRDILPDDKNPYTTSDTIHMLETLFEGEDIQVMSIPDIESINWGRGVGYETNEFPAAPVFVSGTEIRRRLAAGEDVDHLISPRITEFL